MLTCQNENCNTPLTGLRRVYCSTSCKMKTSNHKHQNYQAQQARGLRRKKELILLSGGKCTKCNYNKNIAGLCFHHTDNKDFALDMRSLSNNSMATIMQEFVKCVLLCHNCHMEEHHPELSI